MGCFSFLCVKSNKPALSTSFDGSHCFLFLMKEGMILEEMHGNYDSYGRVFDGEGDSFKWKMDWSEVCGLMQNSDCTSGIAMVLGEHYDYTYPVFVSEDDPNQGWGDGGELIGDCSDDMFVQVEHPYHKDHYDSPIDTLKAITDERTRMRTIVYLYNKSDLQALEYKYERLKLQIEDKKQMIKIYEDKLCQST